MTLSNLQATTSFMTWTPTTADEVFLRQMVAVTRIKSVFFVFQELDTTKFHLTTTDF